MSECLTVTVDPAGRLSFLWEDTLGPQLVASGECHIRRASHVEPTPGGLWQADLSPVNGPLLGPFYERQRALTAEREWLESHTERWKVP